MYRPRNRALAHSRANRRGGRAGGPIGRSTALLDHYRLSSGQRDLPTRFCPPTFLWRDSSGAVRWVVEVAFDADGPRQAIRVPARGEYLRVGEIDQRCIASHQPTSQAYAGTSRGPNLAAGRRNSGKPSRNTLPARFATVTITGYAADNTTVRYPPAASTIRISRDPVGAPIFYRDVPLMPSETEKGVIKPLSPQSRATHRLAAAQCRRNAQPGPDGGHP